MKIKTFIKAFAAALFTIALFSCSFGNKSELTYKVPEEEPVTAAQTSQIEYGYITVKNATYARSSIVPESDAVLRNKLTNIALTYTHSGGLSSGTIRGTADTDQGISAWQDFDSKFPYELQTGSYTFALTAELNGITFEDSLTATITKDTTQSLSFVLQPPAGSLGSLKVIWNLTYGTASSAELQFVEVDDSTNTDTQSYNDLSSGKVEYTKTGLLPGEYNLSISFYAEPSNITLPVLNTWSGRVRIVSGIETSAEINWAIDKTYIIVWEANGGIPQGGSYVYAEKYTRKSVTITLPELTKAGYTFDGWLDENNSPITSIPRNSTGNKILTAQFTANSNTPYVVNHWQQNLHAAGTEHNDTNYTLSSSQGVDNLTGETDTLVTITVKDTTSGYFQGFSSPSTEELEAAQQITIAGDGSTVVDLYYDRTPCHVIYNDNVEGQTIAMPVDSNVYYVGDIANIVSTEPSRIGYTFMGWATTTQAQSPNDILKIGGYETIPMRGLDINLYAQWEINTYTVTFDTRGGSEIQAQTVSYGDYITDPGEPTKEGFTFYGWFLDKNLVYEFSPGNMPITSNLTLYTRWRPVYYAKLNDTYYSSYDDIKRALTELPETEEITVTFYAIPLGELGNLDTAGSMIYAAQNSRAQRVNFIIYEDVSLAFGEYNTEAFAGCTKFVSIDLRGVKSAYSLDHMFYGCTALESVTFADNFDTSQNTSMAAMFSGCRSLTTLDLSMFDTSKVENMSQLFYEGYNLTTIYVSSKFNTSRVSNSNSGSGDMFTHCDSLVGGNGSTVSSLDNNGIVNLAAAKIDEPGSPGLFTRKALQSLNCSVGDIILVDGTVVPFSIELSNGMRNNAIAVIFYDGTGSLGDKPLGLGLYQRNSFSSSKVFIAAPSTAGYSASLNSDDNSGKVFTQAIHDCADYNLETSRDYYPVFNALDYYYKETGDLLTGSVYRDDWYLPSKNELLTIKDNLELINTILAKFESLGVSLFDTKNNYWAAYQSSNEANLAGYVAFGKSGSEAWVEVDKSSTDISAFVCAIHEF